MRKPNRHKMHKTVEPLVKIFDICGTHEFKARDLPPDLFHRVRQFHLGNLANKNLLMCVGIEKNTHTWKITDDGVKWVKWYKEV